MLATPAQPQPATRNLGVIMPQADGENITYLRPALHRDEFQLQ